MTEYRALTWPAAVKLFREFEQREPSLRPMRELVERLASSPYAAGLYPSQSMSSLRLHQTERFGLRDDLVSVDLEGTEFVVRYASGPVTSTRRPAPVASAWEKRSVDGFAALERCFEHLRWFSQYGALPK